ncbi:allose ABC transporter ATP-binding protein [Anaerosphaera aminiphila DSM 21120]|uniref:Allose ABC transporter ATP-binding protein n=1 Tax=Anaerosphaera aminiphila DSM 21120 TaxID=1120995 RepID=A0A1M5TSC0_9FIRM|nr:ATP-binding cassette domain-containing protein [Anaerosphaera aminiphila]SHH53558.1 allose ABC transporter ATP-binding protein [Anaerosphaera aminiphila DSM 21120]
MEPLIKMENIVKEFPGVVALSNINFEVYPGEVHILLGENGAGKSTLMKILSGAYRPTSGSLMIKGKEFSYLTPKDSIESGISIIYQELSVINELSILENLFVGVLPTKKVMGIPVVNYREMNDKAKDILEKVGLKKDAETPVEELSIGEKQQVEIAKALIVNSDVIIMDEPSTSLTDSEVDNLFRVIEQLKSEGKAIIYITHKMREIKLIGDRVTVLKDGEYVGDRDVKDVEIDELISMMVGRKIHVTYQKDEEIDFTKRPVILEVKNLCRKDNRVKNISFNLHEGEILGFSGLVGSGRTELMDVIFGAVPKQSGEVIFKGKAVNIKSPYDAVKNGFAMVTENRREMGFLNNFDIKQNISIVPFIKETKFMGLDGLLDFKAEHEYAVEQEKNLNIKCRDIDQNITELSGGNQQKVILGKWLAANSDLIIFDEPTKGIDVGSKHEIYKIMRDLADKGKGVLVISSELPELMAVCDRMLVFCNGSINGEFNIEDVTEEKIIKAATGA